MKNLSILFILAGALLSCEGTQENLTEGYDNLVSTMPPDQAAGARDLLEGGRSINMERASEVGNICYDCDQAQEAALRSAPSVGGDSCRHFNKFKRAGVPEEPLKQALFYFKNNKSEFANQRYISIADYSQNSRKKRFYRLDMQTGEVRKEKVSHGSGANSNNAKVGDPNHDGMIDRCHHGGNINNRTNMTRAGFFSTASFYSSASHKDRKSVGGRSVLEWPNLDSNGNNGLRMRGLSPGVNDEALTQGVIMHGAWYNDVAATMGRSYGCPAFESDVAPGLLRSIRGGTMYYSYTPRCRELHAKVERQVRGWQGMCD